MLHNAPVCVQCKGGVRKRLARNEPRFRIEDWFLLSDEATFPSSRVIASINEVMVFTLSGLRENPLAPFSRNLVEGWSIWRKLLHVGMDQVIGRIQKYVFTWTRSFSKSHFQLFPKQRKAFPRCSSNTHYSALFDCEPISMNNQFPAQNEDEAVCETVKQGSEGRTALLAPADHFLFFPRVT